MTTREYQEAYDDDSDRVREWAAQDDLDPWNGWRGDDEEPFDTDSEDADLLADVERLERVIGEVMAERDAALAAITRVEALATQWEQPGPPWRLPLLECAVQLFQAIDEAALGITGGPVE